MAENSGKSLEMIPQGLHFGTFWVTFGALCALLVHFVASVFQAHFPGPKKELWCSCGGCGAEQGPVAVVPWLGGGSLSGNPGAVGWKEVSYA